jgi:hypothetical protein
MLKIVNNSPNGKHSGHPVSGAPSDERLQWQARFKLSQIGVLTPQLNKLSQIWPNCIWLECASFNGSCLEMFVFVMHSYPFCVCTTYVYTYVHTIYFKCWFYKKSFSSHLGPNPTTSIYNASVVNFYNNTGSLARLKANFLLYIEKHSSPLQRWRCSCKFKSRGIDSWLLFWHKNCNEKGKCYIVKVPSLFHGDYWNFSEASAACMCDFFLFTQTRRQDAGITQVKTAYQAASGEQRWNSKPT